MLTVNLLLDDDGSAEVAGSTESLLPQPMMQLEQINIHPMVLVLAIWSFPFRIDVQVCWPGLDQI